MVTGKVRFSYANVFEPRAVNGGDEKYSITLLIPKSDTSTYQRIMEEINKTLQESVADRFKGIMPTSPSLPIYDGDGLRPGGEPFGPECKGCWVMSAKSNCAPEVVDVNCQPIFSKNEFYSGCYGRASITFYAYNTNGNKGIGCGLGNIQKLEDGQPLDGRTTAAEDFATPYQDKQISQHTNQYQAPVQSQFQQSVTQQQYQQMSTQPVMQQPVPQQAMQPATPGYQIDPITGQSVVPQTNFMQPTVNNIYGVN